MRYSQAEKMEIIRLVEESELPVKHALDELGVARSSFYRWYTRYEEKGYEGPANRPPDARRTWNRIPENEKAEVIETALDCPEMSPRQLVWHITDTKKTFISYSSVYWILKSYNLITRATQLKIKRADSEMKKAERIMQHKEKGSQGKTLKPFL